MGLYKHSCSGTMLALERMGVSRGGNGGLIFQTASLASIVGGSFNSAEEEIYTATKWAVLGQGAWASMIPM